MPRNLIILSMIVLLLPMAGCNEAPDREIPVSSKGIGDLKLYTFLADEQYFLKKAQPYVLSADTSLREALLGLGRHLSNTYFSKTYTDKETGIHFEIDSLKEISADSGILKIAVIDMVDKHRYAMKYFFQGSTGGQTTFSILGATFMQPHLEHPLLDGLVILYNGEMLPELDHINLSGILTPRLVRYVARRAIYNTRMEPADSGIEWHIRQGTEL